MLEAWRLEAKVLEAWRLMCWRPGAWRLRCWTLGGWRPRCWRPGGWSRDLLKGLDDAAGHALESLNAGAVL